MDVFFVISDYLITDLLSTNRGQPLRGFWIRRARRLIPLYTNLVAAALAG